MPQGDLAIRFSEEMYASKNDVSRILKISQIDSIWSNILKYRSQFTHVLDLRNIDKTPFNLVLTPTIMMRVNKVERKLIKLMVKFMRLLDDDSSKVETKRNAYAKNLRFIADKYGLSVTDEFITNLVFGTISSMTPQDMLLQRYLDGLKYVEKNFFEPLNVDFLAKLYSIVSGNEEIVSLYRLENIQSGTRALIDRFYNAAPVERIEQMMDNLLSFINDESLSSLIRGICAFYFVQYIKPFDCYSEEIGLLLMKAIFAHNDLDELGSILSLENLLINKEENANVFHEVQKTNDMTYLLVYTLDKIESSIDELTPLIMKAKADSISNEFFKEEVKEETTMEIKEVVKEVQSEHVNYEVKVALPVMPMGLDERDAKRIEETLLELNPNLKKGEAFFYARHCTIGKYYTIQQYKSSLNCAYETARTSMDKLVYEGFYRKEMVKNKFVYTPIPRK